MYLRRWFRNLLLLIPSSLLLTVMPFEGAAQTPGKGGYYEKLWKEADSLMKKSLPKSALVIVDRIYKDAAKNNRHNEMVKAVMYRIAIRSSFEEEVTQNTVASLRKEIETTRHPVVKSLLESMLAEIYWGYYRANQWDFYQRTVTSGYEEQDFSLWDLNRLSFEVIKLYRSSMANEQALQKVSLKDFDNILLKADGSKLYRPTMYDFLAFRALSFFSSEISGLTRPADQFTLSDPRYLGTNATFLALDIQTTDTFSTSYHALRTYQALTRFHLEDNDPRALIETTIGRINFVKKHSQGFRDIDKIYTEHLKALSQQFQTSSLYPWIRYQLANHYYNLGVKADGDSLLMGYLREAHSICVEAIETGGTREGVADCKQLISQIERPWLMVKVPEVSSPSAPVLFLTSFKNHPEVFYRILRVSPEQMDITDNMTDVERAGWLARQKPLHSWSTPTLDPGDFRGHSFEYATPELGNGYYLLAASGNPDFSSKNNEIALAEFQVSNIASIQRTEPDGTGVILVTNRESGVPLEGIKVIARIREYDYQKRKWTEILFGEFLSDPDGQVRINPKAQSKTSEGLTLEFIGSDGDTLYSNNRLYLYRNTPEKVVTTFQTHLFLDRMIYRPGQTMFFKGIVIRQKGSEKGVAQGFISTLRLLDVNGKEVSNMKLTANEFGSFQGSFVLPATGLTGMMTLASETGSESFSVEEYKRPKFTVKINPFKEACKPGDEVSITGAAEAYAGFSLTGAKVTWRVTRQKGNSSLNYRYPYFSGAETAISNGETTIADDGLFTIRFLALPDGSVPPADNLVYYFTVQADVTDLNGETHSTSSLVLVGYKALQVGCSLPAEVDKNSKLTFPVSVKNLNGQEQKSAGTWQLKRIPDPKTLYRSRLWDKPDLFVMEQEPFQKMFPYDQYKDEVPTLQPLVIVASGAFQSGDGATLDLSLLKGLVPGNYILELETRDPFGGMVKNGHRFLLFSADAEKIPSPAHLWVKCLNASAEPGEKVTLLVGSAQHIHARMTIEMNGKVLEEKWLELKGKQQKITFDILETHRGGIAFHLAAVHHNRSYLKTCPVDVPFTQKKLDIRFATFRDKLQPGEDEEYRITITGYQGEKVMAELLTGMYDASLDAFAPNAWGMSLFSSNRVLLTWTAGMYAARNGSRLGFYRYPDYKPRNQQYDRLNWFGYSPGQGFSYRSDWVGETDIMVDHFEFSYGIPESPDMVAALEDEGMAMVRKSYNAGVADSVAVRDEEESVPVEVPALVPRTNFNETAFFFPQLKTDGEGNIVFSYRVPESLTAWKLMCLAHTPDLSTSTTEKRLVTQKQLMVIPNAPRFFREQDHITFTAKVTNLSATEQACRVVLKLTNGLNGSEMDAGCSNSRPVRQVTVKPGQSAVVAWDLIIPERAGALTYRVTAASDNFSDGEEMTIPVLTNRMLVTETMPMPLNGKQTKEFTMDKLVNSSGSSTLQHHKLTLEFTSNPAWYAIQALPYLMEYPYECSEQLFSRYFANSMASHIANSSPKIKQVFDSWKSLSPDALRSNLEKNQELKALLLEETPWVMEGASETARKQRIALLFDLNRIAGEKETVIMKLKEQQTPNGGWPWFKGGPDSWYITQHIVSGMYRLHSTGVSKLQQMPELEEMTSGAIYYLDKRIEEYYAELKKAYKQKPADLQKEHLSQLTIQYLYARSGFLEDFPLNKPTREAFEWLRRQAVQYWTSQDLMMQGYLALALNHLNEAETAQLILKSLKERSLVSEEMGMYWQPNPGYYWYQAPIERQALLIEAFAEVAHDAEAVELMKAWLLKQKQTQDWKTTKATTEACFALVLRGSDLLASSEPALLSVGGKDVDPYTDGSSAPEAGTGYIKVSWSGAEINPQMGKVKVTSQNDGISWGALYWQYFEQLDKITGQETPLSLKKQLFVEENTSKGVVIKPVNGDTTLQVGDKIVVRIELRVDRDMEYVHMKDMRASAFEPVTTVSGYHWQQGLGYYESPRDAAVNFFFDYLQKGTYLFEYRLHITHAGDFSNGITSIQCMYAPEFASHSEGIRIKVRE